MTPTHLLLRYGELFLKGKNQAYFRRCLAGNIHQMTGQRVSSTRGRLVMPYFSTHRRLQRIFGLLSYSPAIKTDKDIESIKKVALSLLEGSISTFKVETHRADKTFALPSQQLNIIVGQHIEACTALQAEFDKPAIKLFIEINQDGAYIFTETISCPGGLPVGSSGKVALRVENDASILAGLLMMKRGCTLISVGQSDTGLLQLFSPHTLESVAEISPSAVLVSGENFENRKKNGLGMVLKPLIAYSQERIEQELEKYRRIIVT